MSEEEKEEFSIKASVSLEDGVLNVLSSVDIVLALEKLAERSDNSIDDVLVKIVAAARDNMDWKGVAKEFL